MLLLWQLLVFWGLLHLVFNGILGGRHDELDHQARPHQRSTVWRIAWATLHVQTTRFNQLPAFLLHPFSKRRRAKTYDEEQRPLGAFWDVGAITAVVMFVMAQAILAWSTVKSVIALLQVLRPYSAPASSLTKRALGTAEGSAASSLVLRPIIPGVTMPFSALPLLLLALGVAQGLHEAAHAVAAASESVPVVAAGLHLTVILPTFYVSLASSRQSLRINAAGVWQNIVLAAIVWSISQQGLGLSAFLTRPFLDKVPGVVVVSVDSPSPLQGYLPRNAVVTHLDDVELDSTNAIEAWTSYLSSGYAPVPRFSSMGWCLPKTSFSATAIPTCCSMDTPAAASTLHDLCFDMSDLADHRSYKACLDPLPLFYPSKRIPQRCLSSDTCGEGVGCAVLNDREKVLRIGVAPHEREKDGRTVVFQGSKSAVLHTVHVSDSLPRFWWVSATLLRGLEPFYSLLVSLSCAVAFFNLLPLPQLDGTHILSSFLAALSSDTSPAMLEEGLGISVPPAPGLLESFYESARKVSVLRKLAQREDLVTRRLTTWTVVLGTVLLGCTLAVEVSLSRATSGT